MQDRRGTPCVLLPLLTASCKRLRPANSHWPLRQRLNSRSLRLESITQLTPKSNTACVRAPDVQVARLLYRQSALPRWPAPRSRKQRGKRQRLSHRSGRRFRQMQNCLSAAKRPQRLSPSAFARSMVCWQASNCHSGKSARALSSPSRPFKDLRGRITRNGSLPEPRRIGHQMTYRVRRDRIPARGTIAPLQILQAKRSQFPEKDEGQAGPHRQ